MNFVESYFFLKRKALDFVVKDVHVRVEEDSKITEALIGVKFTEKPILKVEILSPVELLNGTNTEI